MKDLAEILSGFQTFQLSEQPKNDLMSRHDTKYVFHISELGEILKEASHDYRRLNINEQLTPSYESVYFDTPSYGMYISHHNKRLNRYKVRLRRYNDTGVQFLEIKFKNNKRFTKKARIKKSDRESSFSDIEYEFLKQNTPFDPEILKKSLKTKFSRITFSDYGFTERITIDILLELNFKEKNELIDDIVICEVKKNSKTVSSKFEKILFEKRIKPFGISKYCLGNYYLNDDVKHNLYKEKVILLQKILQNNE